MLCEYFKTKHLFKKYKYASPKVSLATMRGLCMSQIHPHTNYKKMVYSKNVLINQVFSEHC